MGGAGRRRGLFDWFIAEVFCVGFMSTEAVIFPVEEPLQIPENSLLQSGSKVKSVLAGADIQSSVYGRVEGVSKGFPAKEEHRLVVDIWWNKHNDYQTVSNGTEKKKSHKHFPVNHFLLGVQRKIDL